MSNQPTKKLLAHPATIVAAVALVPFVVVLGHGFVFDDHYTIVHNDLLARPLRELLGLMLRGEGTARGLPDASRPAMVVTTFLERRLFGDVAFGYHVVSWLAHGLTSAVAAALALALTRQRRAALVAGLFFALAPIHAEVVACINYREDLIATLGLFVALLLLLVPVRDEHGWRRASAVAAALALALLGKESAAVFPLVFVALALALGFGLRSVQSRERSLTLVVCVLITYGLFRYALALGDDGVARGPTLAPVDRLAATGRYLLQSLLRSLVPLESKPFHAPLGRASHAYALVPLVLVPAILLALRSRRHRTLGFGLLLATLLPLASGPFTSAANELADRYFYGSVLGGGLVFAWLLERPPLARRPRVTLAFSLVLVLVCAGLCFRAAAAFHDDLRLFERAVEVEPTSARAQLALAWARRIAGDLEGAERALDAAERLEPRASRLALSRGMLALARGDRETASAIAAAIASTHGRIQGLGGLERCAARSREDAMRCGRSIRLP